MTFATMDDCTIYCEKTGDIPVPPQSQNARTPSDDTNKVEAVIPTTEPIL